jgi:HemY protein
LKALVRAGAMTAKEGQHRRAVLLAERARLQLLPETTNADHDAGLRSAREALKLDSALIPARLILVNLLLRLGKKREALKLIEQDWDSNPHPLLARAYIEAEPGERPADRMKRLERLQRQNPNHIETHRALGMAALAAGLWGDARRHIEKVVAAERSSGGVGGLSHATCRAMAALEEGERPDPGNVQAAVRQWLDAAAEAQPDPAWICSVCGHPGEAGPTSGHWQAVCPHCSGIDSFRWQRPVLPSADTLLVPAAVTVAAEPALEPPPVETPVQPTKPVISPQIPAPETPPASAEKRLETQLAPSVDAARLIN